jgi:dethiobiotin synthetase
VNGLFITGTDTGVGKTCVAAALLRLALRCGRRPRPFKPVETGCDPLPRDALLLWEAAGRPIPLAQVCPYPLALPAAPAAAARAEGAIIDPADLAGRARVAAAGGNFLVVEGAGGLLVPYRGSMTAADLAALLALPVLLVARTALGTINHTALTLSEISRRGLWLAGVVLVQTVPEAQPHDPWNADLITDVTGVRPFGTLPYLPAPDVGDPERLADALEDALGPVTVASLLEGTAGLKRSLGAPSGR